MSTFLGLALFILGIAVWFFGTRWWLLGAGAGALLGIGLVSIFPTLASGWLGLIIIGGLAILFGVLGGMGKAFAGLIAMIVGFIIGGGVTMALLDTLGLSFGIGTWLLALLGGLIVAVVFSRFLDWALIIFASLLGSMIIVRSLMAWLMPSAVPGAVGTFLILVLTGVGIFFHYRQSHFKK